MHISENRGQEPLALDKLQKDLSYFFKDRALLIEGLSHKSYANELKRRGYKNFLNNERLEFLGDAVLDLALSELLMEEEVKASEGYLSKKRASLVNEESLFVVSKKISLGNYILLGKGEIASFGQNKPRLLSCCFEALIGAIFKDSNYLEVKKVVRKLFMDLIYFKSEELAFEKDYKTRLQEYCQQEFSCLPEYEITYELGPAHKRIFTSDIHLNGKWLARGNGSSKKMAEQYAAKKVLEMQL